MDSIKKKEVPSPDPFWQQPDTNLGQPACQTRGSAKVWDMTDSRRRASGSILHTAQNDRGVSH